MSKIAELLKLAEQKKEDKPKIEAAQPLNQGYLDGVSKSKQLGVTRSKQPGVINTEQTVVVRDDNSSSNATAKTVETSPTRDYTKVSNSITKHAIPERYFRGLSKHTYDVLYQHTRGAVKPTRIVQLTKDELVKLTGISKDAIKLHIKYLKETGLLESRPAIGVHAGWEYEIFVPEELEETAQLGVSVSKSNRGENLHRDRGENLHLITPTNLLENKGLNLFPKTSFKTKTKNDDDKKNASLREFAAKLDDVSRKLTGKGLSESDAEKWGTFAELLVLELEIAAKRTTAISSVPALLTEMLRRRFFASRQQTPFAKSSETKIDTVGQSASGSYEIKPLVAEGKAEALTQLREFAGEDFLQDFKKWYTPEDWTWLTEQLKKTEQPEKK